MVNDKVKSNPAKPDGIIICSSVIEQVIDKKNKKEKMISTGANQRDGFTKNADVITIKLEGKWNEKQQGAER